MLTLNDYIASSFIEKIEAIRKDVAAVPLALFILPEFPSLSL